MLQSHELGLLSFCPTMVKFQTVLCEAHCCSFGEASLYESVGECHILSTATIVQLTAEEFGKPAQLVIDACLTPRLLCGKSRQTSKDGSQDKVHDTIQCFCHYIVSGMLQ